MSTYLGNPALSTAVKDRVSSTFHQALALYRQGRIQEVVAGCTLILQMDPLFDPAKKLMEKARNPSSPIDVETLSPTTSADEALREARNSMTRRDFQRVIQITTEILTNDLMNDDARILGDEAREKMEAGPFVEQFARKCEQHLANGNLPAAKTDLEKARALDPDHPMIKQIEKRVSSASGKWPAASMPGTPAAPPAKPSFVVDNPPPTTPARSTAQASDFGFTFEEEKQPAPDAAPFSFGGGGGDALSNFAPTAPASFSFDAPAAPGFSFDAPASSGFSFDTPAAEKAPVTGEFDFSTASIETSADDQKKIDQYLADGDRAAARGDYQEAIDLWSRIFLIDVTNETASDRIEKAKLQRREIEAKMDVLIAAGATAFDRGDREGARAKFAEVLRLDPHNVSAQDYMDRIAEQTPAGGEVPEAPYVAPPAEKFDIFADVPSPSTETLLPPDPGVIAPPPVAGKQKAAPAPARAKPKKTSRSMPTGALLTILAIALLGGGGWYAWQQFANRPPAIDPAATQQIFAKANNLANKGQYDQAIALLQDVKPDDSQHDRALNLIADLQKKKSQAAEMVDGKPAGQFYQEQVEAGRAAFEAHDYVGAKKAFEQAQRVKPIPDEVRPMYDTAALQVAKLDAAKALFNERRYADAIANLQPLLTADPSNKNIARMINDAHFNLGATALQEEKLPDAMKEFDEVLKTDPNDELARRSRELAVRYSGQPKDLLYKIYVKYLPLRQVG
ncbi:MAG TPA: tetratricopeptide repeat protein [Thermoanaerobaculia bacterium]|nr:tetratricopeptide repeat protein [Thermoanaerobaculia bacterium]